jgi:hypothetical protein
MVESVMQIRTKHDVAIRRVELVVAGRLTILIIAGAFSSSCSVWTLRRYR